LFGLYPHRNSFVDTRLPSGDGRKERLSQQHIPYGTPFLAETAKTVA
jgi:hypothetical protein